MWTPTTRAQHSRTGLRYGSDVTDAEWLLLSPFLPAPSPCGRHRKWEMREIVNAIFYVLRGGIAWSLLPKDFPPWPTVYRWFARFRDDGTWVPRDMCGRPAGFKVASQRSMAAVRLRSCVRLLRAVYDREPRWVPRMAFQNNQPALRCLCRALDVCHSSARPIAIFSYRS